MTMSTPTQPVDSILPVPPVDVVEPADEAIDDGPTCMQDVLDALCMTARVFARKYGFNAGAIYDLANGTRNSSYDLLWTICSVEPRISAEYLLRGEGKPLRNPDAVPVVTVQQLEEMRVEINKTIDRRL